MTIAKPTCVLVALGVIAAPLALAVPANAAQAMSSKSVYACQKKKSGKLRVVKKKTKCKKKEKKISWSTKGPKGDQGSPGTPGTPGASGTPGAPGAPGPGATAFSVNLTTANLAGTNVNSTAATVGDMALNFQCSVFLGLLGIQPRITSPTAGTYITRGTWLNDPNPNGGGDINQTALRDFTDGSISAGLQKSMTSEGTQVSTLGTPPLLKNFGSYTIVVANASGSYLITYSAAVTATVPAPAGPKGSCSATGWWSKLA